MFLILSFLLPNIMSQPIDEYDSEFYNELAEKYGFVDLELGQTCTSVENSESEIKEICLCSLPDSWQGDRVEGEFININTVYDKNDPRGCTDHFNHCAYGVGYDIFMDGQRIKTDLIDTGIMTKDDIMDCMMRQFYFMQRAKDIAELYNSYLVWYGHEVLNN